jgi:secondary thiamine-phosphate synthase enzyme
VNTTQVTIDTTGRRVTDITDAVLTFVRDAGTDGLLLVFVAHATAGVALMETGSGSEEDLEAALEGVLPRDDRYRHRHGPTGHGADHLLPVFVTPSLVLPVKGGDVVLGTWQRVVLVDTNTENNRRNVLLGLLPG